MCISNNTTLFPFYKPNPQQEEEASLREGILWPPVQPTKPSEIATSLDVYQNLFACAPRDFYLR